jgi:hypothetical protein
VLGVYFNHNKHTSFVRQLSNYGFVNIVPSPGDPAYGHPSGFFKRDHPELVKKVKRRQDHRRANRLKRREREYEERDDKRRVISKSVAVEMNEKAALEEAQSVIELQKQMIQGLREQEDVLRRELILFAEFRKLIGSPENMPPPPPPESGIDTLLAAASVKGLRDQMLTMMKKITVLEYKLGLHDHQQSTPDTEYFDSLFTTSTGDTSLTNSGAIPESIDNDQLWVSSPPPRIMHSPLAFIHNASRLPLLTELVEPRSLMNPA